VVSSAIPPMNAGYTPAASSIVPPEIPGTRLARPIRMPPQTPRSTCFGSGAPPSTSGDVFIQVGSWKVFQCSVEFPRSESKPWQEPSEFLARNPPSLATPLLLGSDSSTSREGKPREGCLGAVSAPSPLASADGGPNSSTSLS
jgi:hypothetical protein